jgi:hypothetical protein
MSIYARPPGRKLVPAFIRPIATYCYIDAAQVWLLPLSDAQMAWLQSQCHTVHVYIPPPQWRIAEVRLQLKRPSRAALQFVENIGARVNYIEVALDWIFATAEDRDQAREFVDAHSYKKRLRRDPKYDHGSRYTNAKGAATNFVVYNSDYCKLTGEPHCLHHELRVSGTPAMRRHNLSLLKLDLPALWHAWAFLYGLDLSQLGRMVGNITLRRRKLVSRRTPRINRRGLNVDRLIGGMAFRASGASVQTLVNYYRKRIEVMRCLYALDMSHLIPKQGDAFIYDRYRASDDALPTTLNDNENVPFVPVSSTTHDNSLTSVSIPVVVIPRLSFPFVRKSLASERQQRLSPIASYQSRRSHPRCIR